MKSDSKTLDSRLRGNDKKGGNDNNGGNDNFTLQQISKEDIEKVGLALWLVNSTITDPKLEDILNFGNTKNLKKRRRRFLKNWIKEI
jgi:hypothetical protein